MNWKRKRDEAEVEQAVREGLPTDATPDEVLAFGKNYGMECGSLGEDGVIACRAPARSGMPLVAAEWIVAFFFDAGELSAIEVKKGLTGP